ncbi:MAG: metallophosphoesterase [Vampirovibrio sp.]|nr:metallophosphoesterase [Vampirovibrio sp.]
MKSRLIIAFVFLISCFLLVFGLMRREHISPATAESRIDSPLQAINKLKLPLKKDRDYRFIAFGDWGAGTPFQKDIAAQVTKLYDRDPYDAVLMLGDNIYPTGDIKKFGKVYFTEMYPVLIQNGVNFIVALGNHDRHDSHELDQLAFFRMPGFYYQVSKPHVDFFVLETNLFAKDQVQQKWLEKALKDSKADWKIVMGHHPIYSSGEHGMNAGLKKTLEPILVKYKADMYLAGHDHEYERFKPIQGVQHIVSGGGGAYLRNFNKPLPASMVRLKAHHFLNFNLTEAALKMQVIDKTGKTIDHAVWTKAGQAQKLVKG